MDHSNGKFKFLFFSDEVILLNKELATGFHPTLADKLSKHPLEELEIRLAEIASHCDVILDGEYYPEDLDKLAGVLCTKLKNKRETPTGILFV